MKCLFVCVSGTDAGVVGDYVEALLTCHFEFGDDTSSRKVLIDCAKDAGLDELAAEEALDSDESLAWLWSEDSRARQSLHVTGVPHYIITERSSGVKLSLSGAVKPEEWHDAFQRLMRAYKGSRVLSWPV